MVQLESLPSVNRISFPAASSSAWPSPAPWSTNRLLLDESLSALDYKLRKQMQNELKACSASSASPLSSSPTIRKKR
jgi:hypothetical protein